MRAKSIKDKGGSRSIPLLTVALLVAIVATLVLFVIMERQKEFQQQYLLRGAEQQVLGQKIAKFSLEALRGNEPSFQQLQVARDQFSRLINELKNGAPGQGLPPSPEQVMGALRKVENSWLELRSYADEILRNRETILSIGEFIGVISELIPQLQETSDEVVRLLVRANAPSRQIYVATRQLMLAQRIDDNVAKVLLGGADTAAAIDQFAQDADLFGRVLEGMLKGDNQLNIRKVTDPAGRKALEEVALLFATVNDHAGEIIEATPALLPALEAIDEITPSSERLDRDTAALIAAYREQAGTIRVGPVVLGPTIVTVLGAVALGLLILLGVAMLRDARRREAGAAEQNRRNQEAIRRLLDEMVDLADGDLTIQATVTEDISGAIADSVNQAVEEMRSLVATINETSVQVSSAAQETKATAMHLSEASEHQREQIVNASDIVRKMSSTMDEMATKASHSVSVARESLEIAHEGGETVRRTIEGMDRIRDQIQETSKRIKRLGESSQEIGNIVELIEDIADQTNILALNAAMQAAMAGEQGRGFAVVADEVQRLAERATDATKQIETLVKTIQADTNEAVISMEASTSEVISGAERAEEAGEALKRIEEVSRQIAEEIEKIAADAIGQSDDAKSINDTMSVIQEITHQTSEGTEQTARSIEALADMAQQLRETVARFKLPDEPNEELRG
ncbi:methyl-accepting chemotaxis protein [endosymbiont of unidentified scaly snail isolate Monju]|uniref:methyl-accepting chemotaxis protein n=1 Tax=endosymbiont of unidentified scaly snail isolate Monju TaxID=1248727 RepID=UPI0005BA2982|nr:methyl-accepting chemotaxis protein [endosymbiont of unidentified scaly snail isolate Monju]